MDNLKYKKIEEDKNKLVYQVTVEYSVYQEYADKAFKIESAKVKIPGFRPGQAPKEMMEKEVASKVFNRAINNLLPDYAESVLVKDAVSPISHLHYDLKEFDEEKGVVFTFEVITQPNIVPADFKKIDIKEEDTSVKEDEVIEVLKNMIKNNVAKDKIKFKKSTEEGKDSEEDFDLDDEIIAELKYEDTKTLEEAKAKVLETLTQIKKQQSESEFANKLVDKAVEIVGFHLPHEMVDNQVEAIEEDFKSRLTQIGLNLENYLKTQGKTIEEMRTTWEDDAKKRIAGDLLLVNLSVKEGLIPTEADVESEIEKMEDPELKKRYASVENKDYLKTLMARERGLTRLIDIVKAK